MQRGQPMNKQIEEMAKDLSKHSFFYNGGCLMNYSITAKLLYEAGYRKPEWISVEERLPDDNGTYLVIGKSGTPHTAHFYKAFKINGKPFDANFSNRYVRYWMPLPEPPKEGDKNDA